jgi:DNA-binding response OmpR family regulator
MGQILLVEDAPEIAEMLELPFRSDGHELVSAGTLKDARALLNMTDFDAILLDLNLPDGNGIDLCREVRADSTIPILIITAKRDEVDRILGLEFGADDYIVKPFSPREVVARVNAVLRRQKWSNGGKKENAPKDILEYMGLFADTVKREIRIDGKPVSLTRTEYQLVITMLRRPGMVFSRDQLIDMVWEGNYIQHRVVDSVISRLRRKLGKLPDGQPRIKTVHGVGYALAEI